MNIIQEELLKYNQWVTWKFERRGDYMAKVPYTIFGARASVSSPMDWTTYEKASQCPDRDGVGFVFTMTDPFIGIDFDHIRSKDSGFIAPDLLAEVMALNTYTEISPSGTGLHAICKGTMPPGKCRGNNREMYKSSRFFTVTGNHLEGTPLEINVVPIELLTALKSKMSTDKKRHAAVQSVKVIESVNKFSPEIATELVKKLSVNPEFVKLARGVWQDRFSSQSEADFFFCRMIADETDNVETINYIFRKSALFRPKWNTGYGKRTVDSAITASLINMVASELV